MQALKVKGISMELKVLEVIADEVILTIALKFGVEIKLSRENVYVPFSAFTLVFPPTDRDKFSADIIARDIESRE